MDDKSGSESDSDASTSASDEEADEDESKPRKRSASAKTKAAALDILQGRTFAPANPFAKRLADRMLLQVAEVLSASNGYMVIVCTSRASAMLRHWLQSRMQHFIGGNGLLPFH